MVPDLPGLWSLTPYGAFLGLVVLFWWLLASGRLVPRKTHERELDAAKYRGDEWKETSGKWEGLSHKLAAQNSELLEGSRVTTALMRASASGVAMEDTQPNGGA